MPDTPLTVEQVYDRQIGQFVGLPDCVCTKPATKEIQTPITGVGETFVVQTYRLRESGDTIFLKHICGERVVRIAIPPGVADIIARQRESLTTKVRRRIAKTQAQDRKDRGELPGFMRKRKGA
jgi:hypothetical protein